MSRHQWQGQLGPIQLSEIVAGCELFGIAGQERRAIAARLMRALDFEYLTFWRDRGRS